MHDLLICTPTHDLTCGMNYTNSLVGLEKRFAQIGVKTTYYLPALALVAEARNVAASLVLANPTSPTCSSSTPTSAFGRRRSRGCSSSVRRSAGAYTRSARSIRSAPTKPPGPLIHRAKPGPSGSTTWLSRT